AVPPRACDRALGAIAADAKAGQPGHDFSQLSILLLLEIRSRQKRASAMDAPLLELQEFSVHSGAGDHSDAVERNGGRYQRKISDQSISARKARSARERLVSDPADDDAKAPPRKSI